MATLTYHVKRLQTLASKCGVDSEGKKSDEPQVDTSKMTQYELGQYRVATQLKRLRENIAELDGLGEKASQTQKTVIQQQIRKDLTAVKKETAEVMKAAKSENRKEEYQELKSHVEKTEALYKNRFRSKEMDMGSPGSPPPRLDMDLSEVGTPMVSLRDDEEFMQFFEQTKQNDVKIDEAVDRISAGVSRLHDNALAIKDELKVQNAMLNEVEEKTDRIHGNLKGLNKKLKQTINEVDKDKICIYVFCCVLLLGLAGGVYWVIEGNKK